MNEPYHALVQAESRGIAIACTLEIFRENCDPSTIAKEQFSSLILAQTRPWAGVPYLPIHTPTGFIETYPYFLPRRVLSRPPLAVTQWMSHHPQLLWARRDTATAVLNWNIQQVKMEIMEIFHIYTTVRLQMDSVLRQQRLPSSLK